MVDRNSSVGSAVALKNFFLKTLSLIPLPEAPVGRDWWVSTKGCVSLGASFLSGKWEG